MAEFHTHTLTLSRSNELKNHAVKLIRLFNPWKMPAALYDLKPAAGYSIAGNIRSLKINRILPADDNERWHIHLAEFVAKIPPGAKQLPHHSAVNLDVEGFRCEVFFGRE